MNSVIKEWRVKRLSLFYKKTNTFSCRRA